MFNNDEIEFFDADLDDRAVIPLSDGDSSDESTGHIGNRTKLPLDLNRELIKSPASTFFARLQDESLRNKGDLLIIDKSTLPYDGCLVVTFVDGEFILKRISIEGDTTWFVSAKGNCEPIKVGQDDECAVWGVVKYLIRKM